MVSRRSPRYYRGSRRRCKYLSRRYIENHSFPIFSLSLSPFTFVSFLDSTSPRGRNENLGRNFSNPVFSIFFFFDHDFDKPWKRIFRDGQYVDIIGFALRFERAARKTREMLKRRNIETVFFCFFLFFLPRLAPTDAKSSNCGLVNANDEKFRTGRSQVSGHERTISLYIRNVLLRRFWFATPLYRSRFSPPNCPQNGNRNHPCSSFPLFARLSVYFPFILVRSRSLLFSYPFNGGEKMKRNCVACEERILSTYKSVELYLGYTTFLEVEVGSRRKREDPAESIDGN